MRILVVALAACAAHAAPPPARVIPMSNGDRYVEQHARARDRIVSIAIPDDVPTETVVVLDPVTRAVLHREYVGTRDHVSRFFVDHDGDVLIGYIEPAPPPTGMPCV